MKMLLGISLLFYVLAIKAESAPCWDVADKSRQGMLEVEGLIQLLFRDATNCNPIAGADVELMGQHYKTDSSGAILLDTPSSNINRMELITVSKSGYMRYTNQIDVAAGSIWQTRFLLSQEIPATSARFVLSWGNSPADLDLHLKSAKMHISYRHKTNVQNAARLDIDARKGFGPETITLDRLDRGQRYQVLVHQYSRAGKIKSPAQVAFYANSGLDRIVELDGSISGRCLQVAEIVNGMINYNTIKLKESMCK